MKSSPNQPWLSQINFLVSIFFWLMVGDDWCVLWMTNCSKKLSLCKLSVQLSIQISSLLSIVNEENFWMKEMLMCLFWDVNSSSKEFQFLISLARAVQNIESSISINWIGLSWEFPGIPYLGIIASGFEYNHWTALHEYFIERCQIAKRAFKPINLFLDWQG